MKHATASALDRLEPLLADLRRIVGLKERSRGVFYHRGRAFLHFHEDPKGVFADLRAENGQDFDRFDVGVAAGSERLLAEIRARVA